MSCFGLLIHHFSLEALPELEGYPGKQVRAERSLFLQPSGDYSKSRFQEGDCPMFRWDLETQFHNPAKIVLFLSTCGILQKGRQLMSYL